VRWWPRTLFARTAATLAAALLLLQLVVFAAMAYYVTGPLGWRAADDLAALMVLSAQTWAELPPATRPDFERELAERHGLVLEIPTQPLPEHRTLLPYRRLLEVALECRLGHAVPVLVSSDPEFYWVDLPIAGRTLRMGFARERIGAQPPYALAIIFTALTLVVLVTALVLARRLTRPLRRLAQATRAVGRGALPTPLPETGPDELVQLARRFNRMAHEVQELLADRTTLLAGISHDLRTPLARLRLAVAMLPRDADPALLGQIETDLEAMDRLIGRYLELARGMTPEPTETVDLRELIDKAVTDARTGARVRWEPETKQPCLRAVAPLALERILANLLDNARRYGGGDIEVECDCGEAGAAIAVRDRGPGIPPAERERIFRPFHRLDSARGGSGGTGLGLAIARQLATSYGWEITLDNRPGGGTEARVVLADEHLCGPGRSNESQPPDRPRAASHRAIERPTPS
jgi:two-component system osmolarity sensor histidine kinase EnvZ